MPAEPDDNTVETDDEMSDLEVLAVGGSIAAIGILVLVVIVAQVWMKVN